MTPRRHRQGALERVKNDVGAPHMVDPQLLEILVCPDSRQAVREAPRALLHRVNAAIAAGGIANRGGEAVREPVEGGLVREDGAWLYPVREGIPIMLIDEAIPLESLKPF